MCMNVRSMQNVMRAVQWPEGFQVDTCLSSGGAYVVSLGDNGSSIVDVIK